MTIFIWIVLAIVIGSVASGKNRSGIGYFFLSLCLSPLIGGLILALAGNKE